MTYVGCVLVVDDDPAIREMLAEYLGAHGFRVVQAEDGASMRAQIEQAAPDLVLLDLKLPREDGLSLARHLRERYDVGIIMVTGSDEVIDRIVGLEVGADDYVTKPFDPRELLARMKSVMRRIQSRPGPGAAAAVASPQLTAFGRCKLHLASHQLFDESGSEVCLTAMEFDLLQIFADNPGKALSRDRILNLTRHRDWEPFDRSVDIRVARLRRKVEPDPENPRFIRTVRGVGYMYVPGAA